MFRFAQNFIDIRERESNEIPGNSRFKIQILKLLIWKLTICNLERIFEIYQKTMLLEKQMFKIKKIKNIRLFLHYVRKNRQ